jgi:hypothetical protein
VIATCSLHSILASEQKVLVDQRFLLISGHI